jgi:hypothetical protein
VNASEAVAAAGAVFVVLMLSVHIRPPRRAARGVTLTMLSFLMSTLIVACLCALITGYAHGARDLLAAGAAASGGLLVWLARGASDDGGGGDEPEPPAEEPPPPWDWHDFDRRRALWERDVSRPRVHA